MQKKIWNTIKWIIKPLAHQLINELNFCPSSLLPTIIYVLFGINLWLIYPYSFTHFWETQKKTIGFPALFFDLFSHHSHIHYGNWTSKRFTLPSKHGMDWAFIQHDFAKNLNISLSAFDQRILDWVFIFWNLNRQWI